MAVLYISEYANTGGFSGVGTEPAITDQTVAIAAGSAQSNAFRANTNLVRLHTDAICSVLFGSNPTATATNKRLPAGAVEYFYVAPGQKVAVITNT